MNDKEFTQPIESVNPYVIAARLVGGRILWDVRPESWRSRRQLRRLKDTHSGRKAVVLCNGPSLLKTDFARLQASGAFVFGLNKINLLFDRTTLRPDAIVAVNSYVIEQNRDFFDSTDIPLFLDSRATAQVRSRDGVTFLHAANIRRFARDCSTSVVQGHTVTYVALQLAYHFGFAQVGLVGCDHNFAEKGPANKTVTADATDASHFDPRYFANGVKWQLPDLLQSEVHYLLAREAFESTGRLLANCTIGGKLEVFQRMELEEFLRLPVASPAAR